MIKNRLSQIKRIMFFGGSLIYDPVSHLLSLSFDDNSFIFSLYVSNNLFEFLKKDIKEDVTKKEMCSLFLWLSYYYKKNSFSHDFMVLYNIIENG